MATITCYIVDDEPRSIRLITSMLKDDFPEIKILGTHTDAQSALMQISQFMPDIIFLDIHMPGMDGFTLLSKIPDYLPEIVFITAYQEYALKAFDVHASGYLTKPIHTEKFQTCVHNILNKLQLRKQQPNVVASRSHNNQWEQLGKIVIPIGKDSILTNIGDLIFLESLGNYTRIYLQDHAPVLVCKQLGKFQQELPETHFCRIHHKYLVALFQVLSFSSGPDLILLMNNGMRLPVSRRQKKQFFTAFDALFSIPK